MCNYRSGQHTECEAHLGTLKATGMSKKIADNHGVTIIKTSVRVVGRPEKGQQIGGSRRRKQTRRRRVRRTEQVRMRQTWRSGWQRLQWNQPPPPPLHHPALRQSESVAPSPVSQAAWRDCIDNIPACKAQSIPRGAQQQVEGKSPDGLLAPRPATAARRSDLNPIGGRCTHTCTRTGTLLGCLPHTSFILILSLPLSHSLQSGRQRAVITEEARRRARGGGRRESDSRRRGLSSSLLSHQKC